MPSMVDTVIIVDETDTRYTNEGMCMSADQPNDPARQREDENEMTTQQVMDELGVSRATLYKWSKSGKLVPIPLPAYLERAPRMYRKAEVMRLKREGRKPAKTSD